MRYKTLKSVAHNLGHSFISTMNYDFGDYILGHIQSKMRETNISRIEIDLITDTAYPKELLTPVINNALRKYSNWLPELLTDSNSDITFIQKADIAIEFDLSTSRICPFANDYIENPFICTSRIVDDRGKEYSYVFKDWWFPENDKPKSRNIFTRLLNFLKHK